MNHLNQTRATPGGFYTMAVRQPSYRKPEPVKLVLEDGTIFSGYSFGAKNSVAGEVVFNTGMVGYPESLTDPSYWGQILVLTYPLIGNYGVPGESKENNLEKYFESEGIQVLGLIVSNNSEEYSHWNAAKSLDDWLQEYNVPGIYGLDTRELTKKLREEGTMLGRLDYDPGTITKSKHKQMKFIDPNKRNLVSEVSIKKPVTYKKGKKTVLVIDCGVKNSIINAFLQRDITVIRCPWNYDFLNSKQIDNVDGIVISNGPGDPKKCGATIENVRGAIAKNIPILGICLGSQILGLAAGADTYKLKYGHRSQNQPCMETGTKRCYITPQNHGFAIDSNSLPEDWREWFFNNNDETNEGIFHISKPFFGTQFHPEASPGPDDTEFLFDMFLRAME
jgi:carbamoyl-phosphate synthase small subunit